MRSGGFSVVRATVHPWSHWSNLRSQVENFPHQPDLHFLMRKDLYFHVGYATKIKSGASHNINFSKTKMPQSGAHTIDDLGIAYVKVSLKIMAGN